MMAGMKKAPLPPKKKKFGTVLTEFDVGREKRLAEIGEQEKREYESMNPLSHKSFSEKFERLRGEAATRAAVPPPTLLADEPAITRKKKKRTQRRGGRASTILTDETLG